MLCRHCNATNGDDATVCRNCGAQFDGYKADIRPAFARKEQRPAAKPQPQPPAPYDGPGMVTSVIALLVNVFIFPGCGTLLGGNRLPTALTQIALGALPWFAFGGMLAAGGGLDRSVTMLMLAIPVAVGAWIWGIVTGLGLIRAAERPRS